MINKLLTDIYGVAERQRPGVGVEVMISSTLLLSNWVPTLAYKQNLMSNDKVIDTHLTWANLSGQPQSRSDQSETSFHKLRDSYSFPGSSHSLQKA